MSPPVLTDLTSLTKAAALAEALLLDWLGERTADPEPPPVKDIALATQALWRLTAVRKTLLGLDRGDSDRFDPDSWPVQSGQVTPEAIAQLIARDDEDDRTEDDYEGEDPALEWAPVTDPPEPPSPNSDHALAPIPAPSPSSPRALSVPACPTIPAASLSTSATGAPARPSIPASSIRILPTDHQSPPPGLSQSEPPVTTSPPPLSPLQNCQSSVLNFELPPDPKGTEDRPTHRSVPRRVHSHPAPIRPFKLSVVSFRF